MEKLGLALMTIGFLFIAIGFLLYLGKYIEVIELKMKLIENPLMFIPIKKNGFTIGFSPLLFIILLILYLLFLVRK
ncbi:MAG TPA: hypothetical protein EYG81_05070 [Archaeoglobus profundus]|nr:hypothetical protein [Archaeoglobus profundus]HIP57749.1 hypothetical protein [Archaeoglobus profundus]